MYEMPFLAASVRLITVIIKLLCQQLAARRQPNPGGGGVVGGYKDKLVSTGPPLTYQLAILSN